MKKIVPILMMLMLASVATAESTLGFSVSLRNAKVDTVFDWQFAVMARGVTQYTRFEAELQIERQDGVIYLDQEYFGAAKRWGVEVGSRFMRSEEADLYQWQFYAEKKFLRDIIGIGIVREYRSSYLHDGETMARTSIYYAQPIFDQPGSFASVSAAIDAEYNRSDDSQSYRARVSSPVRFGHLYSLEPMFQFSGTSGNGTSASKWQAKVILEVHF